MTADVRFPGGGIMKAYAARRSEVGGPAASPTAKPDTPGPSAATVPATSRPSTAGATGP